MQHWMVSECPRLRGRVRLNMYRYSNEPTRENPVMYNAYCGLAWVSDNKQSIDFYEAVVLPTNK